MRLLLLALFCSTLFCGRCAITIHSGGLPSMGRPKNHIKRLLFRLSFAWVGAVICVNQRIAEYFQEIGVKTERIHVITPFAYEDEKDTVPLPDPIKSFISEKKPLLCSIGGLEPEYNVGLLLRVFGRFATANPQAGLVMIGSGSLHAQLEKTITDLQLRGKVLLAGDIRHSTALKILSCSDCYVRTSEYDGDCISLKEAIHLRIPAIATDTGMRPREAILFPIGDEKALLNNLENVGSTLKKEECTFSGRDVSSLAEIERVLSQFG